MLSDKVWPKAWHQLYKTEPQSHCGVGAFIKQKKTSSLTDAEEGMVDTTIFDKNQILTNYHHFRSTT